MFNPPTSENIIFPEGGKDSFPTVYDAGNTSIASRYTKVWAEYHNKLRNFIGKVEPLVKSDGAFDESKSLHGISLWTLSPAPTIGDIIYGYAKTAYNLGKLPPSKILPFEIVITSSLDSYSNWPSLGSTCPILYQASSATINSIIGVGNTNLFTFKPMVQCNLRNATPLNGVVPNWLVTSHCIAGTDTLLIRGAIINGMASVADPNDLPTSPTLFFNNSLVLNVSIVGAR